ncbi:MAG: glycosyltransferase family 2 protein [Candidatus Omnitrophota bacterium]|nr:glycosyltransferase family 2 protein [Candidatus Omnitrophota bacterium]MBU1928472.1 glycosyltransferase family 2 protein [Candidatus Omnitrophota bacterium]MBU2035455.1 glycosyltransferase family 2 protein [Candidatus Omnitrophota bacterium]MBU2221899.1 glycosyltransferase family 2 protein [Candidatus Omnitrophota bacterium]MBU2257537.1 glycosyltransferase family 2 protein [Candidatus Omnitrophota bacterium]
MESKVIIVILNWNGKNDLLECLASVERIDYSNFEVIVVDNGSVDGSLEAIRERFNKTIIIENKENTGFCRGNNIGISYALKRGAEYLLILNNDTIVEPSILNELKVAMDTFTGKIILSPLIAFYQDRRRLNFLGAKIDLGNGGYFAQYKSEDVLSAKGLLDIDYASGCAVFFKPEAVEKSGLLDERYFAYYEDIDWSFRCKKNGFRPKLYPKVLVFHKGLQSSGGAYSPTVYFYLIRNRLYFIRKHSGVLRKIQFSFYYLNSALKKSAELSGLANPEAAGAVLDGLWSGLMGCERDNRMAMPEKFKNNPSGLNVAYLWVLIIRTLFFRR